MKTRLRLGLLGSVGLVALGAMSWAPVGTCAAQGGSGCVPDLPQEPAAGNWRGEFTFDYKMTVPDTPAAFSLKPAHERIVGVTALALRSLLDGTAKGDAAAKPRLWRLMSVIEGFGRETYLACPAVRESYERLFGTRLPQAISATLKTP